MSSSVEALASLSQALTPGTRVRTTGLSGANRAWVLSRLQKTLKAPLLCVTADEESADHLADDLAFFLGGMGPRLSPNVVRLPADEVLPWDELVPDQGAVAERLGALFHLGQGHRFPALVLSTRALARRVLPPKVMDTLSELVSVEMDLGRDALARKLTDIGYRNAPLVEDPGTFSLRGDLLDVFPALHDAPVRLEFFGDTIESMRTFDPDTQRTLAPVTELTLMPARELLFNEHTKKVAEASIREVAEHVRVASSRVRERIEQVREGVSAAGMEGLLPGFFEGGLATVFDYLPGWAEAPVVWLDDPTAVDQALSDLAVDIERSHADALRRAELTLPPAQHFLSTADLWAQVKKYRVLEGGGLTLDTGDEGAPVRFEFGHTGALREAIRNHHGEEGALSPLLERLTVWRDEGMVVMVGCGSAGQADRLKRLLADRQVNVKVHPGVPGDLDQLNQPNLWGHLFTGEVSEGFVDDAAKVAVLSDEDIFGPRVRRKTRRKKSQAEGLAASFKDLKEGDLCVHTDFGVCRYQGLLTMQLNGVAGDFLVLEFHGKDKVYLPVSRMRLVSKFTGGDAEKVSLDRLGTNGWEKKKAFVKEQLLKMAADLLQLYASRKAHPGHGFTAPDRYFRQFEADFDFEETPDQQKAIDDVLADMQKKEPMDRLVCGDVGYGKTEVAMRAAFKAVLDRKQVAVLVPTTLLAHQHFASFQKRFQGYPVTVEVISSLKTTTQVREVLQRAREGRLDVLIGTHKLLNAEVGFKDLGLMIIDEEQKFGVKQKEALKRLRTTVDSLTLTATPIPRTLNMAMAGMRDMSLITTPPADRRAIRTFITRFDTAQIKEAILRELKRGGQVFFVHNRVQSIHSMEKLLQELLPGVPVGVAHGQMPEGQLEKVMLDFVEKRTQVLLATSIIESGIDISNANTMIVNRADHFGLSQLYQLRGRVGRSKERAYAYLVVPQGRAITRDAARRLEVLQSFSELGAGFNIASHDLEIRGAGNLLGGEQSGSIEAVGFDLYAQMLQDAIHELKGEPPMLEMEPDVNLPVPAFLPETYVPDVHLRLVLYKRMSQCQSSNELIDLRSELVDRFGDAPPELDALQELLLIKQDLRRLRLRQLDGTAGRIAVTLGTDARLDGARVAALVQKSKGLYRLTPDMKLLAKLDAGVKGEDFIPAARKVMRDLLGCEVVTR